MSNSSVVIVAARRTPVGAFQGALGAVTSPQLGSAAIRQALADSGLDAAAVSEVLMGCVLPAGLGQAPARQAALDAGVPDSVGCTTINKVCGSAMKATMLGFDMLRAGAGEVIVAGGMESMSNAPYLLPKARAGYRMGHNQVLDHMFFDGLQNPYDGNMMGHFAEETVARYGFSREAQDAYAATSVQRARDSIEGDAFADEVVPVTVRKRRGETVVEHDEEPYNLDIDKIASLRPAFRKDGTVTAASSSSISDGAAALVLMREDDARARGLTPLALIHGHASFAGPPEWFTTAPASAVNRLLEGVGWQTGDVDLFEINEAFACVTMAAMQELHIDHDRVNVQGGACALGHPIGATGARLIVTLLHALRRRELSRGVATLCIGGGESTAVAIEAL